MSKSKTLSIIFLGLILGLGTASAQQQWTLDSCISYAVAHNIDVRLSHASTTSAALGIDEARAGYMPNVSAGLSQSWNLGRALTSENTYSDRNTAQFGWNAQLSVPVFDGLATPRRVKYAKANLAAVTEQYEAACEDVSLSVITAYLQVLCNRDMYSLAAAQADLSRYQLSRQQALADAGKIPEIDILEARAQLATDELNVTQTRNDWLLSRLDLMQLLQIQDDVEQFDVAPLSEDDLLLLSPDDAYARALQYSHRVQAAGRALEAARLNVDVARAGYLPRLSFNGGIGSSYYNTSGFDNESFSKQMNHNFSTYFGLSLNIPIFDAFGTRNSVRRARVQQIESELNLEASRTQLHKQVQQAYYQALGADKKLASCLIAEQAAAKAFEAMTEKYDIGRASPTEYEQAKNKALQASIQTITARYEKILRTRLLTFYASEH